tara:strand:- start:273 stop:425 length:153 start_codon:yes stop_codon:yes gene_type:complete
MTHSQEDIKQFIQSLNEMEKLAYKIAKEDLGSSFDITKSIGFLKWLKNNK